MNRCDECGKIDWGIGHAYWRFRRWFRLKLGLDTFTPAPRGSSAVAEMLKRHPAFFEYMAATSAKDCEEYTRPLVWNKGPILYKPSRYGTPDENP